MLNGIVAFMTCGLVQLNRRKQSKARVAAASLEARLLHEKALTEALDRNTRAQQRLGRSLQEHAEERNQAAQSMASRPDCDITEPLLQLRRDRSPVKTVITTLPLGGEELRMYQEELQYDGPCPEGAPKFNYYWSPASLYLGHREPRPAGYESIRSTISSLDLGATAYAPTARSVSIMSSHRRSQSTLCLPSTSMQTFGTTQRTDSYVSHSNSSQATVRPTRVAAH